MYLMGLGELGNGNIDLARQLFLKVLHEDQSHKGAAINLKKCLG
jgi:hypothetical protein